MDTKALDSAIEFIASTHGGIFMKDAKKASAELVALKARLAEAERVIDTLNQYVEEYPGHMLAGYPDLENALTAFLHPEVK